MTLEELRVKINQIDDDMMTLFLSRMAVSKAIGEFKKSQGVPVLDANREKTVLCRLKEKLNDDAMWPYYEAFMKEIMRLSKEIQA